MAVFVFLVDFAQDGASEGVDRRLLMALRTPGDLAVPIGPPWMLQSAIDVSALGGFTVLWLLTLAAAGFLALARRWRALAILVCAVGGAALLNAAFKSGFHRARPDVVPHLTESWSASFPSGHAMISAAAYLTVAAILAQTQRARAARLYLMSLAVIVVVAIGVSRVYLGVHWPSDVAAGWAAGAAWALAFWIVVREVAPETANAGAALREANAPADSPQDTPAPAAAPQDAPDPAAAPQDAPDPAAAPPERS
ncbi:phosphatase PAP2 family protein [Methylocella sp.]|uniref:phosphatase PAP2 family protein n=1 Tax=Methylocella sp. TaxID=1978226 RepID=UPI0037839E8F